MRQLAVAVRLWGASESLCSTVCRCLSDLSVNVAVHRDFEAEMASSDAVALSVWLVSAPLWPRACATLADARVAQPLSVHLVVADGVPPEGIEQLVAHGAVDFIRHPAAEDEMVLRIKRALGALSPAQGVAPALSEGSFRSAKARVVQNFERHYLEQLLQRSEGNITHAARIAKKNRRAFFELLRKYQIDAERFRVSGVDELT
jgi:response regulator RpfG family c-di-GMP phosphodiesterase